MDGLTAAQLLGVGFSFTLHGSDLLQRAICSRQAARVSVLRDHFGFQPPAHTPQLPCNVAGESHRAAAGVDRVLPWPGKPAVEAERRRLCLLAVGRLHRVKTMAFSSGLRLAARPRSRLSLLDRGEGPERARWNARLRRWGCKDMFP